MESSPSKLETSSTPNATGGARDDRNTSRVENGVHGLVDGTAQLRVWLEVERRKRGTYGRRISAVARDRRRREAAGEDHAGDKLRAAKDDGGDGGRRTRMRAGGVQRPRVKFAVTEATPIVIAQAIAQEWIVRRRSINSVDDAERWLRWWSLFLVLRSTTSTTSTTTGRRMTSAMSVGLDNKDPWTNTQAIGFVGRRQ